MLWIRFDFLKESVGVILPATQDLSKGPKASSTEALHNHHTVRPKRYYSSLRELTRNQEGDGFSFIVAAYVNIHDNLHTDHAMWCVQNEGPSSFDFPGPEQKG